MISTWWHNLHSSRTRFIRSESWELSTTSWLTTSLRNPSLFNIRYVDHHLLFTSWRMFFGWPLYFPVKTLAAAAADPSISLLLVWTCLSTAQWHAHSLLPLPWQTHLELQFKVYCTCLENVIINGNVSIQVQQSHAQILAWQQDGGCDWSSNHVLFHCHKGICQTSPYPQLYLYTNGVEHNGVVGFTLIFLKNCRNNFVYSLTGGRPSKDIEI